MWKSGASVPRKKASREGFSPCGRFHLRSTRKASMPVRKTATPSNNQPLLERFHYFESRNDALVQTIREFVAIESPSDNKLASDRLGTLLAARFEALGGRARIHRAQDYADNIQIDFKGSDTVKPVLLLGHFDTVYPLGTLAN